jgi:hypothetical protein
MKRKPSLDRDGFFVSEIGCYGLFLWATSHATDLFFKNVTCFTAIFTALIHPSYAAHIYGRNT